MKYILPLFILLVLGVAAWGAHHARDAMQLREQIARLEGRAQEAEDRAARWEATAEVLRSSEKAQATLAQACMVREAAAQQDAAIIDNIMTHARYAPVNSTLGVDSETRRKAVDMLNRPW